MQKKWMVDVKHHVSIQVSSHEGLGIGFYESIAHGVPVISLDTHRIMKLLLIIYLDGYYLVTYEPLPDNKDPVINNAVFEVNDLTNMIIYVSKNIEEINKLSESSKKYYEDNFNNKIFTERLIPLL